MVSLALETSPQLGCPVSSIDPETFMLIELSENAGRFRQARGLLREPQSGFLDSKRSNKKRIGLRRSDSLDHRMSLSGVACVILIQRRLEGLAIEGPHVDQNFSNGRSLRGLDIHQACEFFAPQVS